MESYSNKRPDIVVFKDIIDEWSERTGKPKELLEDIYKHHTKYIKHIVENNENSLTILLPNLGQMSLNYYLAKHMSKHSKEGYIKKVKLLKELDDRLDKKEKTAHFNIPIFIRFTNLFKKITTPISLFYSYVSFCEEINKDILDGKEVTNRYRPKEKRKYHPRWRHKEKPAAEKTRHL